MSFLVVEQILTYALPLIVLPYLFRVIGPDKFGRIAFAQALTAYAVVLVDYGFNWSATRRIAQCMNDPDKVSRIAMAVLSIKAILMVLVFAALAVVILAVPSLRGDAALFSACCVSVVGSVLFPTWLYQGIQRMRTMVTLSLIGRSFTLLPIFYLVRGESDYRVAALLLSSGACVAGTISLVLLIQSSALRWHSPSRAEIQETLIDGWHLFVSNLSITLYGNTNVFVLGLMTNPAIVGQFAAAERIVRAVTGLLTPLGQAAFPYVAETVAADPERALDVNRGLFRFQVVVSLFATVSLAILATPLVMAISGTQFAAAIVLVQAMAVLPFLIGLSNVLGIQTMLNFGMGRQFSRILIGAGILNLLLLAMLIPSLQAMGAALSVVLSECAVTLAMGYVLLKTGLLRRLMFAGATTS